MKARELEIHICERIEIKKFIEDNHYSKSINGVKSSHCFKVEHCGNLVGAVLFGAMSTTAWKRFGDKESEVIELRRLVLVDKAGKNSESRVIGHCLRWIKKNDHNIKVVVSYADPYYGHDGTIYKASNFTLAGMSGKDNGYVDTDNGKVYHSRALRTKYKGDYKPFVKRLRKKKEAGLLKEIVLPQKYCYTYALRS